MAVPLPLVALDIVASLLTLVLVAFFVRTWVRTRLGLHLLLAAGFLLVGGSFLFVATSEFSVAASGARLYLARYVAQTGGALLLALAYLGARSGDPRVWETSGWAVVALAAILVGALALGPLSYLPDRDGSVEIVAHVAQAAAYAVCAALSWRAAPRGPVPLVPLAFAAFALSKYTWLLIDVSAARDLVGFVYAWRFAGILLLLAAVALPVEREEAAP